MKGKNKNLTIIAVATIILVAILIVTTVWKNKNRYVFVSPKKGEIIEAIYGMDKVKSHRSYDVKVGVMTKVKKVFVKEGQPVKKGDSLIQFTDSAVFKAPFAGTVTRVVYNEPETVLPQSTALTIQDLDHKYLDVSLDQEGALRVIKSQMAKILFESVRGERFNGAFEAIFPKDDEFITHIKVEGLGKNVLPGMTGDVAINVAKKENALLIPLAGVSNGKVLIRRNDKKQKIAAKVGGVDGEWAEVLEGDIQDGDEVLIETKNKESVNALLGP